MNKIVYAFLAIMIIACSKNEAQAEPAIVDNVEIQDTETLEEIGTALSGKGEESAYNDGIANTVYNTIITEDDVSVYDYPSLNSKAWWGTLSKGTCVRVVGTSRESEKINGHTGYWHLVEFMEYPPENYSRIRRWVFSKYIQIDAVVPAELHAIEMIPGKDSYDRPKLLASYQINGEERIVDLYPQKQENQNFYTFSFDYLFWGNTGEFNYRNIPGTYVWFPETNELKHVSYDGTDGGRGFRLLAVTDDFRYLIDDFYLPPASGNLDVTGIEDRKKHYLVAYDDIKLLGNTIEGIEAYNNWQDGKPRYWIDSALLEFGESFAENNPIPKDVAEKTIDGTSPVLIIQYELDFDTGIRHPTGGRWVPFNYDDRD